MKKPTREELILALQGITQWATGMDKGKNPYSYPVVKKACSVLAREQNRGRDWAKWSRDHDFSEINKTRIRLSRMMYAGEAESKGDHHD